MKINEYGSWCGIHDHYSFIKFCRVRDLKQHLVFNRDQHFLLIKTYNNGIGIMQFSINIADTEEYINFSLKAMHMEMSQYEN